MSVPDFAARPQLAEDVARYVRKRIFDGTYRAGEYVRLDQLAAELGISVTPVREALFEAAGRGAAGAAAAPRLRGAAGDGARRRRRRQRAGPHRWRAGRPGRREHHRRSAARAQAIQAQLEEAYAGNDHRADGPAQPRIPPGHQRGRRLTEARPDDVADHPLRTGIGVPDASAAGPTSRSRTTVGWWRRWPSATANPRAGRCRTTWPRGRRR